MKHILFLLLFSLLSILSASCTKEVRYSKEQLFSKAFKADPSTTFIIPKSMNDGVSCTSYTEGCLSAHMVQVQRLDFIAVEFMTEAQAIHAAKKYRGYYLRNWFFDDVTGEPILEKFMTNSLEAKKP